PRAAAIPGRFGEIEVEGVCTCRLADRDLSTELRATRSRSLADAVEGADRAAVSIDITRITSLPLQICQPRLGRFDRQAAVCDPDLHQRRVHVAAHCDRAADVEMGAVLQPTVDFCALLVQALLHVHALAAVAREGEVEAVQLA